MTKYKIILKDKNGKTFEDSGYFWNDPELNFDYMIQWANENGFEIIEII
jgi:hypothetical protein